MDYMYGLPLKEVYRAINFYKRFKETPTGAKQISLMELEEAEDQLVKATRKVAELKAKLL